MIRKAIIGYIAVRTVLTSFYDIRIIGSIRFTDVVGILFPLLLIAYSWKHRLKDLPGYKLYTITILWIMFVTAIHNIFYIGNFEIYLQAKQFARFLNGYAVFLCFPLVFTSPKEYNKLFVAFIVSAIWPFIQVAFNLQALSDDVYNPDSMLAGAYADYGPFILVGLAGSLIFMYYILLNNGSTKYKMLLWISFVLFDGLLFVTLSRTAFLIGFIAAAMLVYQNVRRANIKTLLIGGLLIIAVVTSSFFQAQIDKVEQRSANEIKIWSGEKDIRQGLHGRIGRWQDALEYYYYDYSIIEKIFGSDLYIGPHGDYVFWLTTYGLGGLLLYASLMLAITRSVLKIRRSERGREQIALSSVALCGWIIWVVTGVTTNPSFMPDYSYIIVGITSILFGISNRSLESSGVSRFLKRESTEMKKCK